MAEDQQNPYTLMGMLQMMQPNKYLNPANLTGYNGGLAMPGFYTGQNSVGGAGSMPPTDASGKPITSFQDAQKAHDAWTPPVQGTTTLNQTQQTPTGGRMSLADVTAAAQKAGTGWASVDPNSASGQTWAQERAGTPEAQWNAFNAAMPSPEAVAQTTMGGGGYSHGPDSGYGNALGTLAANQYMTGLQQQQPAAAPAAAPKNPIDMRQAYLDALSSPGKVTTPGANVPAASPTALLGQPSVLSAFMSQHPDGGTAAPAGGGYSNQPFFSTLDKLRASS